MVGGLCCLLSTAPQHSEGVPLPSPMWGVLLGYSSGAQPPGLLPRLLAGGSIHPDWFQP